MARKHTVEQNVDPATGYPFNLEDKYRGLTRHQSAQLRLPSGNYFQEPVQHMPSSS